jgi:glycosyltransferase involved in cell wall biosynthesis
MTKGRIPMNDMAVGLEQTEEHAQARRAAEFGMVEHFRSANQAAGIQPRILYLIGQLGVGGYERQLYYLLQALDRQSYRSAVVVWGSAHCSPYVSRITALGIPVYSFSDPVSPLSKLMALRRLVSFLAPEVIHSYSFYTNFPAWWSTRGTRTMAVGSIRNNFVSEIRESGPVLGRLSARWPALQICNSVAAKTAVASAKGLFKPSRLHVVMNGIDIQHFHAQALPAGDPVLLAVGRLSPQKRWDRLLKAIAMVKQRGLRFSVRHAGGGPLRSALEEEANALGVGDLIQFLGIRQDMPALFANSTFLVHTAEEEGCPNVIMEAMACGRAVVATDAGHSPQLVEDGKTGYIVERGDGQALGARIGALVANRELAMQMGQAGREKAVREFGIQQLLADTLRAYQDAGWKGYHGLQ